MVTYDESESQAFGPNNHDSVATFACDIGFYLTKGDESVTCTDGSWVGIVPTCESKTL